MSVFRNENDLQSNLFNPQVGPKQILLLRVKVGMGVMEMKRNAMLPRSPHYWMQYCDIKKAPPFLGGGVTPLLGLQSIDSKTHRQGISFNPFKKKLFLFI